jgi:hypothetical protein
MVRLATDDVALGDDRTRPDAGDFGGCNSVDRLVHIVDQVAAVRHLASVAVRWAITSDTATDNEMPRITWVDR